MDLKTTLVNQGIFGLAAPQVGVDLRVIAIRVQLNEKNKNSYKDMKEIPLTVMINPKLKVIENVETDLQYEACASVPEITGKVRRYKSIFLEYYTEEGIKIQKITNGYFARLVQHEIDHLDGIVFLDKVEGGFATKNMVKKFNLKE